MSAWRWVLPSFADIFFLVLLGLLFLSPLREGLLGDADTGWHIRTGEQILATLGVPRTDPFSYTMPGRTWYAWEWLYDLLIAAVHHVSGLNGVVFLTAAVISLTFALLFHFLLRRSENVAVAAILTLLAAAASQVHMLARPHVLSWLFTLLWVECLFRFVEGRRAALLWLPPLMLFWVNVHAGWILGLVLMCLFAVEPVLKLDRLALCWLSAIIVGCLTVSLLTPYGYGLHAHVYHYLSDRFLMSAIDEFQSPDFHQPVYLYFAAFLPLSVAGAAMAPGRITGTNTLLWLVSLHAGLLAARNIPIACILMSMALGPLLAAGSWMSWSFPHIVEQISNSMMLLDRRFRGHGLAILFTAACAGLVLHGGRLLSCPLIDAQFNPRVYPVRAATVVGQKGIRDRLFSTDSWGAYLIYRLYPTTRVYFDDRHDFYGEDFVREYGTAVSGSRQWQQPLDRHDVQWVLMPVDAPLSSLLRASPAWRPVYDDGVAILFARKPL
jgi:hypothetical protein